MLMPTTRWFLLPTSMLAMTMSSPTVKVSRCCQLLHLMQLVLLPCSDLCDKIRALSSATSLQAASQLFAAGVLPHVSALQRLLNPCDCKQGPHSDTADPNLAPFLLACCIRDPAGRTSGDVLLRVYAAWYANQEQQPPVQYKHNQLGPEIAKWCCKVRDKTTSYYLTLTAEGTRLLQAGNAQNVQENAQSS